MRNDRPSPASRDAAAVEPGITFDDIVAARARLAGQIVDTPFLHSRTLSAIAGCELWLKFENLQYTASFKERGAGNRIAALSASERAAGVIAVSAGNHAQGVAHAAGKLGIRAVIVMPRFTPSVKVENTRRLGAEVVLGGDRFDEARDRMQRIADEQGLTIIHPYDDPLVIAGQGTLGLEMLEAQPDLDALVLAIGGGGMIAGVTVAARRLAPALAVIGVQTRLYDAAWRQFHRARADLAGDEASDVARDDTAGGPTIAEGIAVEVPGRHTMPTIVGQVDDVLRVGEADIEKAIVALLEIEKTVVEGAGAAGLAAVLAHPQHFAGKRVGLVLSGGNIDPLTLSDIVQRGLARSHRLVRLAIGARDIPGSLARIATILGDHGANIEEVTHQRAFADLPVRHTRIEVVVSTRGESHVREITDALAAAGFTSRLVGP
ncbi:MAG: threonine ammonia-lyase [Burkholderiaceae bacterium]